MSRRLTCVVEGKGEVVAVPNLCARVLNHLGRFDWHVDAEPIRHPRDRFVDPAGPTGRRPANALGIARALAQARARPRCDAVLVLCDADDDCAATWSRSSGGLAPPNLPTAFVMAVREYEGWLLHTVTPDVAHESVRGAKERLARIVPGYTPMTMQLALTRRMDIAKVRTVSRSFDKFVRAIDALCPPSAA